MEVTLKTLFGLKRTSHSLELDFSHCCIRGTGQSVLSVSMAATSVDKPQAYFPLPLLPRDFPGGSDGEASAYNVGDLGSIPGLGRSPGEGSGNPLQYSCLENPTDRGPW